MRNKFKGGAGAGCMNFNEYGSCTQFVGDHSMTYDGGIKLSETYNHSVPNYTSPDIGVLKYQPSAFGQMGGGQIYIKKYKKKINTILEKLKKKYKNNKKLNLKEELK